MIKENRDLYEELRSIGLTHVACYQVLEWANSLPIEIRGSNHTVKIEDNIIKVSDTINDTTNNKWLCQYLEGENLYYLTEHHPEDGVLGEHFFKTIAELRYFITKNEIPVMLEEDIIISKSNFIPFNNGEVIMKFYGGNEVKYLSKYALTMEMVRKLPEKSLGFFLKQMVDKLNIYINKKNE